MKHYVVLTAALLAFAGATPVAMPQMVRVAPMPIRIATPVRAAISNQSQFSYRTPSMRYDATKPCAGIFSTCHLQPCPQPDLSQGIAQQAMGQPSACDSRGRAPQGPPEAKTTKP